MHKTLFIYLFHNFKTNIKLTQKYFNQNKFSNTGKN